MVLKRVIALKKISHFDGQNGQKMSETHDEICLDPQNPLFCIKEKKTIYTKCRPYMDLYSCQLPGTFEKVLTDLIRPNMSKNVVKKSQKIILKKPFWGTSKNWRLDLKV